MSLYDIIVQEVKKRPILWDRSINNGPEFKDLEEECYQEICIIIYEELGIVMATPDVRKIWGKLQVDVKKSLLKEMKKPSSSKGSKEYDTAVKSASTFLEESLKPRKCLATSVTAGKKFQDPFHGTKGKQIAKPHTKQLANFATKNMQKKNVVEEMLIQVKSALKNISKKKDEQHDASSDNVENSYSYKILISRLKKVNANKIFQCINEIDAFIKNVLQQ